MSTRSKILGNAAFLLLCMGATAYLVLRGQDLQDLLGYMSTSARGYWLSGYALVVTFILCESLIIFYLLRSLGESPKIAHCFLYSFVGFFFSLVTPTGSGGQPMQLVFMKHDGLALSRCVLTLLLVTIAYKAVLVIIGLIILIAQPASIMPNLQPAMGWVLLGIVLNVLCVGGMLALVFVPSIAERIVFACIGLAARFIGESRADALRTKAENSIRNYSTASEYIKTHKIVTINVLAITIVQRCLLFAVTFLVLISFGILSLSLAQTILLQGSISLAADMLPLPGGLGISEHLYSIVFSPACGSNLVTPTLVVSRGLSFYAQLITSALFTMIAYLAIFGRRRNEKG